MRTILAFLLIASPVFADQASDSRIRIALALAAAAAASKKAEPVPAPAPPAAKPNLIQAWLAQPRNFGSCPCGATGGCHCSPHSLCSSGGCASHNPLLMAAKVPIYEWKQYQGHAYLFENGIQIGGWDYTSGRYASYDVYGKFWNWYATIPTGAPPVPGQPGAILTLPTFGKRC